MKDKLGQPIKVGDYVIYFSKELRSARVISLGNGTYVHLNCGVGREFPTAFNPTGVVVITEQMKILKEKYPENFI